MSTNERQIGSTDRESAGREHRRLRRSAPAAVACAILAVVCTPATVSAHGGTRVLSRLAGDFRVSVDARAIRSGGRVAAVDYTVTLHRRRSGRPVNDAHVNLTVGSPGATIRPFVAHRRFDTYGTVIPVSTGANWESYRVAIAISSPGTRTATIAYRPPVPAFTWPWRQPLVLGGACLACALYGRAFARLRRRGRRDLASGARLAMFAAGVAIAMLAVISPVDPIGERYLLSTHMLQHVAIGDAAPALVIAGLRGPIGIFVLPRAMLRVVARSARARRSVGALLNPAVALALWAAVYAGWHVPAAYEAALANPALHDLEHASFFAAGFVVWAVLIEPFPKSRLTSRARMGVAVVLLTLGNALSDALLLALHPLYASYADQPVRLWGLSALADQRLAGAVMMVEQLASLTLCMAFLVRSDRRARVGRQVRHVGVTT